MRRYIYYILHYTFILVLGCTAVFTSRADEVETDAANIIEAITGEDGNVAIVQSDVLTQRLMPFAVIKTNSKSKNDKKVDPNIRYRVQIFSDNNRQSAKANAEYRKRLIEQRMPGTHGYVTYDAPYWRVRVGNYQTEAEAYTAMKQIKSQFPAFSSDVRVVKVRVAN